MDGDIVILKSGEEPVMVLRKPAYTMSVGPTDLWECDYHGVKLTFSQPIELVNMPTAQARAYAKAILDQADAADAKHRARSVCLKLGPPDRAHVYVAREPGCKTCGLRPQDFD